MKYIQLLLIVLFSLQITVQAQKYSTILGDISEEEIAMTQYDKDITADAVVLFDLGKSYFEKTDHFSVIFERTTRIKIFNEAGIKWAKIEIPFYNNHGNYEKIFDIEAYTYNYEDGKLDKTKLDISNIYDEKYNNNWNIKLFAMPNVKPGSIIEVRYKINSQYVFNLRDWEFQWKIPVVYSEYEVKMIPFYSYTWLLQGANKFDVRTSYKEKGFKKQYGNASYNEMVFNYGMIDIPAFNEEEFITSIDDYIIKLDFQLSKETSPNGIEKKIMTTWPELISRLQKHTNFGKHIKKSKKLGSKILVDETLLARPEMVRVDSVLNYVKANFNWNKSNTRYASKSPSDLFNEKIGNAADINLFTTGILQAAGIEANPVWISTRKHGQIRYDYPYTHFFNYVIIAAKIDGKTVLLDATDRLLSNDRIPSRCINDKGLLIKKGEVEWLSLQCNFPSEKQSIFSIDFSEDDINVEVENSYTEYRALHMRKKYSDDVELINKSIDEDGYNVNDSSVFIKNSAKIDEPYIVEYSITNTASRINNKIYVSPFLNEPISKNKLKQKSRNYPIDMIYPKKWSYRSIIDIPEGYSVDYLPANDSIVNGLFELNYSIKQEGKKLRVSFSYYFKNSVYAAKNYLRIKNYYNQIVKKGNEKIVLIKDAE